MEKTTLSVQELASSPGVSLPVACEPVKHPDFPSLRTGARIPVPVDGLRAWPERQTGAGRVEPAGE